MNVIVTGASGFIGSHVAERLIRRGHRVRVTGRDPHRLEPLGVQGCEVMAIDLAADNLQPLVREADAVVHCAGLASPWGRRSLFWRHNVQATEKLLAASRMAPGLRRFVFLSSPSIYFKPLDQIGVCEEFVPPRRWATYYGESKWEAELRVLAPENRSLGPIAIRPRAVFGPRDTAILPRLLRVARTGKFPLFNQGRAMTDVTCVDNLVDVVETALSAGPEAEGRAFNVTNGQPIKVFELLGSLFEEMELKVRFIAMPMGVAMAAARVSEAFAALRPSQSEPRLTRYGLGLLGYTLTLSIEAARRTLKYVPAATTGEGIAGYARWWRSQ